MFFSCVRVSVWVTEACARPKAEGDSASRRGLSLADQHEFFM